MRPPGPLPAHVVNINSKLARQPPHMRSSRNRAAILTACRFVRSSGMLKVATAERLWLLWRQRLLFRLAFRLNRRLERHPRVS